MLRFFAGILLVQTATAALVLVAGAQANTWADWWPIALALGVVGLVAAFWFSTLASQLRRDELERLRESFAREREDLRVRAEREKTRLVRQSHKTISDETRRTEARANRKVGAAVAAAVGVGVLMMMANLMTLGLLLLTGAGGALGGYLLRRNWMPRLPRLPGRKKGPQADAKRRTLPRQI